MLNILVTLDETKRIMHLFPERRGGQGISLSFSTSLFRCVIRQLLFRGPCVRKLLTGLIMYIYPLKIKNIVLYCIVDK